MKEQKEKYIFGKNQKQYDYLSYFFFILMTSIALYKLLFQENMNFWAFMMLIAIAFSAIFMVRFRYRRFIIFVDKDIILKKFAKKLKIINYQQIKKFNIKQLYYSSENIARNLAVSGAATLAFVPQDVEKLAETDFSIWTSNSRFNIKLHFLPINYINKINQLISQRSQLKYLNYLDLKNPKQKEILWSWKLDGTEEEGKETLRFLEEIHEKWKF